MKFQPPHCSIPDGALPDNERPRCGTPKDPSAALERMLQVWKDRGEPSQLLRARSIGAELNHNDLLIVRSGRVTQGYLIYRSFGAGRLSEVAESDDGLDISSYFSGMGSRVRPEELEELPILNTREEYKSIVFIDRIEVLEKGAGFGGVLLNSLIKKTGADLVIAHAMNQDAERFFEKFGFDSVGIRNGSRAPEEVMAWVRPRRETLRER